MNEHWPIEQRVDIGMIFAPLVPADEVVLCDHAASAVVQVVLALILLQDRTAGAYHSGTRHTPPST